MGLRSKAYKALRVSNDINAVMKGKVLQRLWRRTLGKLFGRMMR